MIYWAIAFIVIIVLGFIIVEVTISKKIEKRNIVKYCSDCKWYQPENDELQQSKYARCLCPTLNAYSAATIHPKTNKLQLKVQPAYCDIQRQNSFGCGQDAKYFEEKS